MLDPDYLSKVAEGAEQIASELHSYIIKEVVSRMTARLGDGDSYLFTASDRWRIQIMQDAGYLLEDITADISKMTGLLETEVSAAMQDACIESLTYDDAIYKAAGLEPMPFRQSTVLMRLAERAYSATLGEWRNATRTTALAAQNKFIEACDNAYYRATSGAATYTQAASEAIERAAADGVVILYPSGRRDTIESATARAVRTGISQAAGDITQKRMDEMEWDIVLVSAHVGARLGNGGENAGNHHWWQGKFYSRSGADETYPPFSLTGYGTVEGLCGANCRHSFGPGDGRNNPYAKLAEEDDENAGKLYRAEQKQRGYERQIRKAKREVLGLQEAVKTCRDKELKQKLQESLDKKSYALLQKNAKYDEYCRLNNLRPLPDRLKIAKWKREQAVKANGAARRYQNQIEND